MFDNKAIMMSSDQHAQLIEAVGRAVQAFQDATDAFDEAVAARLGLNRTDLRCLSVMSQLGPMPVGEIGRAVGLSRGAATTALDRVERAGYGRRVRDPNDRRGVLIEMTDKAQDAVGEIWGPMVKEGQKLMATTSVEDLRVILAFLEGARELQFRHLAKAKE
jgi:DNA-binding MarR family transcriptional regulator